MIDFDRVRVSAAAVLRATAEALDVSARPPRTIFETANRPPAGSLARRTDTAGQDTMRRRIATVGDLADVVAERCVTLSRFDRQVGGLPDLTVGERAAVVAVSRRGTRLTFQVLLEAGLMVCRLEDVARMRAAEEALRKLQDGNDGGKG